MSNYTKEYKTAMENFSQAKGYAVSVGELFAGLGKKEVTVRVDRRKKKKVRSGKK